MFSNLFDKTLLIPMPYRVCMCRNATGKENGDQLTCEPNPVASCVQGKVTSADSCPPNTRFRRSIRRNPIVPKVKIYPNYAFSKRRKVKELCIHVLQPLRSR